jgi:hypothetical protein
MDIKELKDTLVNKLSLTAEGMENHFDSIFRLKIVKNGVRFYETSEEGRMSLADVLICVDDKILSYHFYSQAEEKYGDNMVNSFLNRLNAAAKEYQMDVKPLVLES